VRLKSVELVNALKAAFEQLQVLTQTSVNINQNVIKAEQGEFLLFAKYFDTISVEDGSRPSDEMVFEFFKTLTDDTGVAENATNAFFKVAADYGYILDDQRWSFIKGAFDEVSLGDGIDTKAVGKALQDISAALDAPAKHIGKPAVADGVNLAGDVIVKITELGKIDVPLVAEEHYYALGKPLEDVFVLGEAHFVAVSKPLEDAVQGFEDHVFIFTKKVKEDTFSATEELAKDFWRPLADSYSLSDGHSLEPGKVLYDVVAGVGDQAFIFAKKVAGDITSAADQINTKGFGKALEDVSVFSEAHHYDMGKPLTDTYSVLEAHSLEPGKVFADSVNGIEDYVWLLTKKAPDNPVGAADQINTFSVGKAFAENSYLSDTINTIYFDKAPSDAPVATDEINSFGTSKQLTDGVNATDDVDGTASILDDQEMQFMKDRTDVASASDSLYRQVDYVRAYTDAGYFGDDAIFDVGKAVFDTPSASDSTNLLTGKHIYDIPVASETLAYALARVRSDSALLGDAKVVTPGKVLLDLASTADAGSLRSQGFADFTYFAEDFVGASRTF